MTAVTTTGRAGATDGMLGQMPKALAQAERIAGTGDSTRDRILGAAAALVAERGWGSVRTRAVAERAGVNQALVHYHFGTMEQLLREAVLTRIEPELRALADELLDDGPFPDGLRRTLDLLDRFEPSSEPGILLAEALLRATRDATVAEAMGGELRSWRTLVEPRIVTAQQRGSIRSDVDAGSLALIIAAVLDGLLIQRIADPDTHLDDAATTLTRLLAPPGGDPR